MIVLKASVYVIWSKSTSLWNCCWGLDNSPLVAVKLAFVHVLVGSNRLRMTLRIKHLQFAKLYLSTHVANTKSMTPNQLRLRASGFKGFRHTPLGPCTGFKAKSHDFYFSFSFFLFLFAFSFLFLFGRQHWSSNVANTNLL